MLPPEIIRQIILEVRGYPGSSSERTWPHDSPWHVTAKGVYPALYNLALTSRAFNTLTTPILYGYLDFNTISDPYESCLRTLDKCAFLRQHVRGLQITNREALPTREWYPEQYGHSLKEVLRAVPKVEYLCLKSVLGYNSGGTLMPEEDFDGGAEVCWRVLFQAISKLTNLKTLHLSMGTSEGLCSLPSLPTLQTLVLDSFPLPPNPKAVYKSLRTLEIYRHVPYDYETTFPSTLLPQLYELKLSGGNGVPDFHVLDSSLVTILKKTINLKILRMRLLDFVENDEEFDEFIESSQKSTPVGPPLELLEADIVFCEEEEDSSENPSFLDTLKVLLLEARSPKLLRVTFFVPYQPDDEPKSEDEDEHGEAKDDPEDYHILYAQKLRDRVKAEWSKEGTQIEVKVKRDKEIGKDIDEVDDLDPVWY